MAFTIREFRDLLRLLDERPEWLAELRWRVLSDDILQLPAIVREQGQHLAALAARVEQIAELLAGLTARTDQIQADVGVLKTDVSTLKSDMGVLKTDVSTLKTDVGVLKGNALEDRHRTRAPAYFGRLARHVRVLPQTVLADLLDEATARRQLSESDREAILDADLVLRARRREDQSEIYLLVEVSAVIDTHDVDRAAGRGAALANLGRPVLAVVAGQTLMPAAAALSRQRGVIAVLDGTLAG